MLIADSTSPEFWGLLAAVVTLASTVVVALVRQLEKTSAALESLQEKMISQAVPALERSTLAGQAMGPILEQNAKAMGAVTKATEDSVRATADVLQWVAVLRDRDVRPPPRRGS